jgi:uncharacterized C2H2 Zn-finger protein
MCDYSSYYKDVLERHAKVVHLGETKGFKCDNCDKAFTRKSTLASHVNKIHNNLNRQEFQCDHCDKAFDQNGTLTAHINDIHKKIKRFFCDLCDYCSYYRKHLERHATSVHVGIKNIKCDQCDKAFTRKEILVNHVNNVHKKLRNHSCQWCNYTTYGKSEMKIHNNAVHLGKKDFRCDHCDRAFGLKSCLNRHLKNNCCPKKNKDQKNFVQVNVSEEILETKETIEIKEELVDTDIAADDPLAFVVKQEPFWNYFLIPIWVWNNVECPYFFCEKNVRKPLNYSMSRLGAPVVLGGNIYVYLYYLKVATLFWVGGL